MSFSLTRQRKGHGACCTFPDLQTTLEKGTPSSLYMDTSPKKSLGKPLSLGNEQNYFEKWDLSGRKRFPFTRGRKLTKSSCLQHVALKMCRHQTIAACSLYPRDPKSSTGNLISSQSPNGRVAKKAPSSSHGLCFHDQFNERNSGVFSKRMKHSDRRSTVVDVLLVEHSFDPLRLKAGVVCSPHLQKCRLVRDPGS